MQIGKAQILPPIVAKALIFLLLAATSYLLYITAWVGEDSYIDWRAAGHFLAGNEPVFNVGERVQVFSNTLFFFVIAGIEFFLHNIFLSVCIASYVFTMLAIWLQLKLSKFDLLASMAILFCYTACKGIMDFSISGLENPLSYLLISALGYIQFSGRYTALNRLYLSTLVGGLLMVNRQDTLLFFAPLFMYNSYWVWQGLASWRAVPAIIARLLVFSMPFWAWHLFSIFYFGYPFPNTYYAKLGAGIPMLEYLPKSLEYYRYILSNEPQSFLLVVAALFFCVQGKQTAIWAVSIILYLGYITSVGGDFMAGRFFSIPTFAAIVGLNVFLTEQRRRLFLGLAVIAVLISFKAPRPPWLSTKHYQLSLAQEGLLCSNKWFNAHFIGCESSVADERGAYFTIGSLALNYRGMQTEIALDNCLRAIKQTKKMPAFATESNIGYKGYMLPPSTYIFDQYALSDPFISRFPAIGLGQDKNWRVGHIGHIIPEGYVASLRSGRNEIKDSLARAYYDNVRLITRAPLFSAARLQAIWKQNLSPPSLRNYRYPRECMLNTFDLEGSDSATKGYKIRFNIYQKAGEKLVRKLTLGPIKKPFADAFCTREGIRIPIKVFNQYRVGDTLVTTYECMQSGQVFLECEVPSKIRRDEVYLSIGLANQNAQSGN